MSQRFAIGDVVALNSGGSTMTVIGHSEDESAVVHCVWFDHHGIVHQRNFHEDTLRICTGFSSAL